MQPQQPTTNKPADNEIQHGDRQLDGAPSNPSPRGTALSGNRTRNGDHLTPREFEVLALIANGKSSKEIAATLGIAFKTVVCHRGRILSKLGFHNAADLTRYAVRIGLVAA